MKESEIVGKNEEYPVHYEVLSGLSLLISRSGKNRNTEVITRENKYKKKTLCNTDVCVTQGHISYFILAFLTISHFTLLRICGVALKYVNYSNSIVPTGFGVRSISTRLIPLTSAVMRAVI